MTYFFWEFLKNFVIVFAGLVMVVGIGAAGMMTIAAVASGEWLLGLYCMIALCFFLALLSTAMS